MSAHDRSVCMVGAFPPPVHGMAMINAAMRDLLASRAGSPVVLNLAGDSLERTVSKRLARITRVAAALGSYSRELRHGRGGTLYVGLSGGWGQLYEALFVALARVRRARIFVHHHSFAYLDRTTVPAWVLVHAAGPKATHIVLCETMEHRLSARYAVVSETRVISNAAMAAMSERPASKPRTAVSRIGFLGNISGAKGIGELLAVAEALARHPSHEFRFTVAGPFESDAIRRELEASVARLTNVAYVGPRYGREKAAFWDTIDVLLFPSRYANEAAPLVVLEAMSRGIPVVAWERGCLSNMVSAETGCLVARDRDFVRAAVECLVRWREEPAVFAATSAAAAAAFVEQQARSTTALNALLDDICRVVQP